MAICNLIKSFNNDKHTGNFIMFSQYAEDLTRNNAEGFKYHVVPSRFIAADINFASIDSSVDWNAHLPELLQNYFENGCAACKNDKDIQWTPETSTNIFWNMMFEQGIFNKKPIKGQNADWYSVPQFRYINEINVQSYDVVDGMGYSEVYCYIPNEAPRISYEVSELKSINESEFIYASAHLEGYPDKSVPAGIKYKFDKTMEFQYENSNLGYSVQSDTEFNVNCIIVLYDINSMDSAGNIYTKYKNIPMGIYLPGPFDGSGRVENTITKYVSSEYTYGSGTSYGIRICTRMAAVTGNDFSSNVNINVEGVSSEEYASICQVMAAVADNLAGMKSIVRDAVFDSTALKDTFAMFKNSRTNVPYPVEVNGLTYWYVNGRNTGIIIPDGRPCMPYTNEEIKHILIMLDGAENAAVLVAYVCDDKGNRKYYERKPGNVQSTGEEEVQIAWEVYGKYDNKPLKVDSFVIKEEDSGLVVYPDSERITASSPANIGVVTKDTLYNIKATWSANVGGDKIEQSIESTLDFKFHYPMFFGLLGSVATASNYKQDNIAKVIETIKNDKWYDGNNITADVLKGLQKYVLPSACNNVSFTSNGEHIFYIYPALTENNPHGFRKLTEIIDLSTNEDELYNFCQNEILDDDGNSYILNKEPIQFDLIIGNDSVPYYLYYTTDSVNIGVMTEFKFITTELEKNNIEYKKTN